MHAARGYQQTLIDQCLSFWQAGGRNALAVLPTGGGKCLGRGTPVLLYDGTVVPVEEVAVGDLLMGPDGKPRRVLSLARGQETLYRIVPSKGEAYVVNESHVLSLKRTACKAEPKYPSQVGGTIVNLPVHEYVRRSPTFKHTHKGWRVGVEFDQQGRRPLPMDPYFLGVWLGDGNSHNAGVTTGDAEIEKFLQSHAESLGMRSQSTQTGPGCVLVKTLGVERAGRGGTRVMNALREIGVLNNKHIPLAFRTGSRAERLSLLAGLLDTDGHYTGKGYDLCLGNERLLDDAIFVARSLGFAAYKSETRKTCHNNGVVGTYWRTNISGDVDEIPCRLPRKKAAPRRQKKDVLVTGIKVERIGWGDYFGFEIDGDRLFLLGDFTVTHNTFVFSRIASAVGMAVCAIAHRGELVSQISLALAREGVRHRVIGPAALARRCTVAHMEELGRDFVQPNSQVAVAGVDTLIKMHNEPWFAQVGLWIQDECFPAGTVVSGRAIEDLRVGDTVDAFDEDTGLLESRRVMRLFKNPAPDVMARVTSAGRSLVCTLGHPFWTARGWVVAKDLKDDDVLLHALPRLDSGPERGAALPLENDGEDLLPEVVRVRSSGREAGAPGPAADARRAVLHVRQTGGLERAPQGTVGRHGSGVLQSGVLNGVQGAGVVGNHGGDEPEMCVGPHEGEQPNGIGIGTPKDGRVAEGGRPSAIGSRWERGDCADRGADAAGDVFGAWVYPAMRGEDGSARGVGPLTVVQGRRGEPGAEDRPGSGWVEPFGQASTTGREAGRVLAWARVEGVALLERGDPEYPLDGHVYNIEVDGLHTYLANDVVVHNCHHVLKDNKWGKAAAMFPNARGLGVTATPVRADGKGLGRHADGLFDRMFVGPNMRELIAAGYLTDYRIFAPPSDIDLSSVAISASGDYSPPQLADARKRSHITGDVVQHYLRIAPGKLGVTFDVDVESATETAAAFNSAGVRAEIVSGKTPDSARAEILRRFRRREVLQLVNVDLFGEGFDLPAIEVVSMARPTQSYSLFAQQFGRSLRPLDGKRHAIIIDHVGNVLRHGLPDSPRVWSLDRRERRSRATPADVVPTRSCSNAECLGVYERVHASCPYCGHTPIPAGRSSPELVDGDLHELDPEVLRRLRGEAARIDGAPQFPSGAGPDVRGAINKNHWARQQSQNKLRSLISLWSGWQRHLNRGDAEAYRRFYFSFGVDVATAQTLNSNDADALAARIAAELQRNDVREA